MMFIRYFMAKNHFKTPPKALSLLVLKVQAILGLNFWPLSRLKIAKSRTLTTLAPQRKIQSWKTWSQNEALTIFYTLEPI